MRTRYVPLVVAVALALVQFSACGSDESSDGPGDASAEAASGDAITSDRSISSDAPATPDAKVEDGGTTPDAAQPDSTTPSDAAPEAAVEAGPDDAGYNDFTAAANWTSFDTTTVDAGMAGYWGGTFDGRYLYAPSYHNQYGWDGVVSRYDTQSAFAAAGSWSLFNVHSVNTASGGYYGAGFDGRYVYFVPPASGPSGVVGRYDTQGTFTSAAAWSTFDATTVNAGARGFVGSVFDGRYMYLVPYYNQGAGPAGYSGIVARFDTQATFTAAASWSTFDTTALSADALGFFGGVFDGRYVYFVPDKNGASGTVTRYDTQAAFTSASSWSVYDLHGLDAEADGYQTAAFDGRYLYFVPGHGTGPKALVARYDTMAAFGSSTSWKLFDTMTLAAAAKGYASSAFDGRYIYFVPHFTASSPAFSGLVVRYDTRAAFDTAGSWHSFDVSTLNPSANGFEGAVFDGRYLYLLPSNCNTASDCGLVMRFDAKSPPAMPPLPAFHGSFL